MHIGLIVTSVGLAPLCIDPRSLVRGHSVRVNVAHNRKDESFLQSVRVIELQTSTFSALWPLRRDITRRNCRGHSRETRRAEVVCPIRRECGDARVPPPP